jgi:hypothetical protein
MGEHSIKPSASLNAPPLSMAVGTQLPSVLVKGMIVLRSNDFNCKADVTKVHLCSSRIFISKG